MNLSPHFTLDELTVTDHREFDNSPTQEEISNLQRLAQLLEQVKEAIGGKPVMINSAFRSKQVNDAVGSSDKSQHRKGCAADFRVPGVTPDEVVRAVIAAGLPFDQIIVNLTVGRISAFQILKMQNQEGLRLSLTKQALDLSLDSWENELCPYKKLS